MSAPSESDDLETASKLERILSGRRIFFRFLKGMAIGIPVVLVLGVIAFYAYENHIGEKAWLETKAKYEQQGLSFDLADFAPEMPLEEENFARSKVIRSLTDYTLSLDGDTLSDDPATRDAFVRMKVPKRLGQPGGSFKYGLPINFEIWINSFRESEDWNSGNDSNRWTFETMLHEMSAFDSEILALNSESKRSRFNQLPLEFGDTMIAHHSMLSPHLTDFLRFYAFIRLRANLAIHEGDAEFALTCIQLMLRIADTIESFPEYIHNMVANTARQICISSVWYGFENQLWTAEELEILQTDLSDSICITAMGKAFHCNAIISYSRGVDEFLEDKELVRDFGEFQIMNGLLDLGEYGEWFPTGWWNQNRAIGITEIFENIVIPVREGNMNSLANSPELHKTDYTPTSHIFYYNIQANSYNGIVSKNLEVQTEINLAITACALERFRLKNDRLPDSIAELKAANLGEIRDDFYNPAGGPLQYRKDSDNGRYLLYSYGSNQKDNGGTANPSDKHRPFSSVDKKTSDIVWRYSSPKILKLKALFDSKKLKAAP